MTDDWMTKAAIAEVVHGYALAIRHRRSDDAAALFIEDGWFEIRQGQPGVPGAAVTQRLDGRDAVLAYLQTAAQREVQPIPMIHNLIVTLDGVAAGATSLMEAQIFPGTQRTLGEYDDRFVHIDGTWRFVSRSYTIFRAPSAESADRIG